jgi:Phasin protein
MKNTDMTEQWAAMQKMFLPTSAISAPLRENAHRFWESQEKVLDNMQALANSWFERRHTGAHKAREAAERMCGTETFADLIQAYQDWAGGAFERIMADGLSCQQQIMATTGVLAAPPLSPSTTEKEGEPQRSESKAPARSKTT